MQSRRTIIRFIVLSQYYAPEIGATQTRLLSVVTILRSLGHDVQIVTAMPNHLLGRTFKKYRGKLLVRESYDGVPVIRVWIFAATGMGVLRLLNYLSFTVTSVIGLLLCRKADYLFIDSPPLFLSLPGRLIGKLRGMRTIFNVADLWPDSARELGAFGNPMLFGLAESFERWTYRTHDVVCAVTHGIDRALKSEKGVPDRKVVFFPNGVDTTLFAPRQADEVLRERFGGPDARVFLYSGTHGAAQGLENVIRAAALLRDTPAFFVFLGDGHRKPALQAMATELGLTNVEFVDSQPLSEVPRYYSIAYASIVALIKRDLFKGSRPQKMFVSLATGVPIVYSGEGEAAKLITDNEAGLVVRPESAEEIAAACRSLMSDRELHDRLGANGRKLACNSYEWRKIVQKWLTDLEEAAA
jgi:colanic acid biosynthesis glycosyl transferase WcaI